MFIQWRKRVDILKSFEKEDKKVSITGVFFIFLVVLLFLFVVIQQPRKDNVISKDNLVDKSTEFFEKSSKILGFSDKFTGQNILDFTGMQTIGIIVTASATPTTTQVGDSVTFSGSAIGTIVLYEWDFDGDGVYDWSGASASTTFIYPAMGNYIAKLKATNDKGLTGEGTVNIIVNKRTNGITRLYDLGFVHIDSFFDPWPFPIASTSDGSKTFIGAMTPGDPTDLRLYEISIDGWYSVDLGEDPTSLDSGGWDDHHPVSLAIDEDGYVHAFGGMHNDPWKYVRSVSPYTLKDGLEDLGAVGTADECKTCSDNYQNRTDVNFSEPNAFENTCSMCFVGNITTRLPGAFISYPRTYKDDNGKIYLTWRGRDTDWASWDRNQGGDMRTVEGYGVFGSYDHITKTWYTKQLFRDPNYGVCKMALAFTPNGAPNAGRIHAMTIWTGEGRPQTGCEAATAKDLSYAYSDDNGITWYKSNGVQYTSLPISRANAEVVVPSSVLPMIQPPLNIMMDSTGKLHAFLATQFALGNFHLTLNNQTWNGPNSISFGGGAVKNDDTFISMKAETNSATSVDGENPWPTFSFSWGVANPYRVVPERYVLQQYGLRHYFLLNGTGIDENGTAYRNLFFVEVEPFNLSTTNNTETNNTEDNISN